MLGSSMGAVTDGGVSAARIFLFYSRADDPRFVARLEVDLVAAGFEIWLDRSSMESRGQTHYAEILLAITRAERTVLVSGPHAARSEYVLWECRQSLLRCKPVVPVLRVGGADLLPPELNRIHHVDAQDDAAYDVALAELVRVMRAPLGLFGKLSSVPDWPPHYLARTGAIEDAKAALLADHGQPVVVTGAAQRTGLYGMGGIGKSVLAVALARDCEVQRAFPNVIFWRTIGTSTVHLAHDQHSLIEALGGEARPLADERELRAQLSELPAERAVLLNQSQGGTYMRGWLKDLATCSPH
jgi:hypothetical protein